MNDLVVIWTTPRPLVCIMVHKRMSLPQGLIERRFQASARNFNSLKNARTNVRTSFSLVRVQLHVTQFERLLDICTTFNSFLSDAKSNGEAENLQNRLRSLSTGLVGLRNSLQDQQQQQQHNSQQHSQHQNFSSSHHNNTTNSLEIELELQDSIPPPPSQQNYCNVLRKPNGVSEAESPLALEAAQNQVYQPTSFEARTITATTTAATSAGEQAHQKSSHRRFNAGGELKQ